MKINVKKFLCTIFVLVLCISSSFIFSACSFLPSRETSEVRSITVKSNNLEWGTASGSGNYFDNEKVYIEALPKEGCMFSHWEVDGDGMILGVDGDYIQGSSNKYSRLESFPAIENKIITAVFIPIIVENAAVEFDGKNITMTAGDSDFTHWEMDGKPYSKEQTIQIKLEDIINPKQTIYTACNSFAGYFYYLVDSSQIEVFEDNLEQILTSSEFVSVSKLVPSLSDMEDSASVVYEYAIGNIQLSGGEVAYTTNITKLTEDSFVFDVKCELGSYFIEIPIFWSGHQLCVLDKSTTWIMTYYSVINTVESDGKTYELTINFMSN